jgi:quercetin dioxygenase-like cupin family protein
MVAIPKTHTLSADDAADVAANYGFLNVDGSLRLVEWARMIYSTPKRTSIEIETNEKPVQMVHTPSATALPLLSNGILGVDLIRVAAGTGFEPHTHPGDHLLICVAGEGTITYDGYVYPTRAGQVYMIEGDRPHAVGAITNHAILAVGMPHVPAGSPDRMKPVEYVEVAATFGQLGCLICGVSSADGQMLHDVNCPHCPCPVCCLGV